MNHSLLSAARAAACLSMIAFFGTGALRAQEAAKPEEKKAADPAGPAVLEKFEVTGSRVKRLDYETPQPVITYTAQNIEEKGYTTLGEFVQSLPYNSATANSEFTTASFITGAATVNPRGLGSNRVLTLINGRRSVPYALTNSASGTAQTVFNFNSVPVSAIDRIEFLKDGASALYGSDAITGVYNIILKKNYSGSSIDFTVSNTIKHDSLSKRISLFTGLSKNGWEITAGANYQSRHSNFLNDFGVTTTDFRYLGVKGANQNSTIFHPSYLNITAAQAVATGLGTTAGIYLIPDAKGTANPTRASFVNVGTAGAGIPNSNRFDFANVTQIYPSSENLGGYAGISRVLTPNVTAFSQFLYSRGNTHYELQPYGFTSSIAGFTIPANNPYNPTGVALTNTAAQTIWTFRGDYLPKREVAAKTATALAGLRGTVHRIWNWETAVSYGQNETTRDSDLIKAADLQAALNGTTRATAYNPFGPSDNPDLEKNLYTRSRGLDGKIDSLSYDLSVNGSFYQLPFKGAGEVGLAAGYEYRRDHLRSNPEPNNYVGFTATTPFEGRRKINSAYVELSAPLQSWLEVQVAARHEQYSDFGNTTKPKYGAKIRLPSNRFVNVILRGSYSESFKAPDIGQLYQPQSVASTSASYLDPLRPQDAARQLRILLGGNPGLKPEEGKVQYSGAVFEVPAIKGLSFNVDFFDIQIRNVINILSATYLLSAEGRRNFPNAVVRDNSLSNPGPITSLLGISNNLGLQLYRGLDWGVKYTLRNTRFGNFTFSGEATEIIKRGSDSGQGAGFFDNSGLYFDVEWRYNYGISWRYKNFGAAVTADIIGKFFNDRQSTATFAGWGENVYPVINPSVSYRGFRRTTITVGASNVFNNRPPPNGFLTLGFDDRAYSAGALGVSVYLRVRKEF